MRDARGGGVARTVDFTKRVPMSIKGSGSTTGKLKVTKRSDDRCQRLATKWLIFMSPEGLSLNVIRTGVTVNRSPFYFRRAGR